MDGRSGSGAAAAWTEGLYRDHGRLVSGLCRALLRDASEGEDAAQQVFLAAHRALLNGNAPREPAAWLATIARNECWARIRARMREPLPTADVDGQPSAADPLAEAIRNADLAALWSAIAELPRQQRDALLLRELGGLSYSELSGALAVSGPAVESLLFRARQGLRSRLQAASAALAGASWVDSLLRLAGSVGGGLAPAAAKVAVVGVGAAVATGGAAVTPRLHHAAPRPAKTTARLAPATSPVLVVAHATRPTALVAQPIANVTVERRRGGPSSTRKGHGTSGTEDSRSGDSSGPGQGTTPDTGETRDVAVESSRGQDARGDAAAPSRDGPSSGGEGTPDGDDGSSSGPGSSGGGPGTGDGGVDGTTADSVVTVTVPTVDEPPGEGGRGSGDGGLTG